MNRPELEGAGSQAGRRKVQPGILRQVTIRPLYSFSIPVNKTAAKKCKKLENSKNN